MPRTAERIAYFLPALAREYLPGATTALHWRLRRLLPPSLDALPPEILDRVHYCNRLDPAKSYPQPSKRAGDLRARDMSSSDMFYYIDLMRHAQGYGSHLRLDRAFGDVTEVPDVPAFVKSRPATGDRDNAVLMPLDILRHLHFPDDPVPWSRKKPVAVWRGRSNGQAPRIAASRLFGTHPDHDIGQIDAHPDLPAPKGFLSIPEQLQYRYILSLEGNDVATNLKWIMASNSVALAPRLEFETWYMEGRLEPGRHFVVIRADLGDLEDRVAWCEENPSEVQDIIAEAQRWTRQFRDRRRENLVAALVVQKYAEATGGIDLTGIPHRLFGASA